MNGIQNLTLSKNNIRTIASFTGLNGAQLIDCSENVITEITINLFADNTFSKLKTLDFHQNKITTIQSKSFKNLHNLIALFLDQNLLHELNDETFTNLRNLQILNLYKNRITNIKLNTFIDMRQKLKEINLIKNRLQTINGDMFGGDGGGGDVETTNRTFLKLRKFQVSHNQLTFIHPETFINTPNIDYLDFTNNKLVALDDHLFVPLIKLRKLFMANNKLEQLQSKLFEQKSELRELVLRYNRLTFFPNINSHDLLSLTYMAIVGNPWHCSCFDELLNFLTLRNIYFRETSSPHFKGLKPICVVTTIQNRNCIKDINFMRENHIIEIFENATNIV